MEVYYHCTQPSNLQSVLEKGLLPRSQLPFNVLGASENPFGITSDPNYIYLFRKGPHGPPYDVGLKVTLPDDHPVTKDYDQIIIGLTMEEFRFGGETRREFVEKCFRKFYMELTGDLTKENIIAQMEKIPKDLWEKIADCYRTDKPVPPECLKVVSIPPEMIIGPDTASELKRLALQHNSKYEKPANAAK